MHIMGNKKPFQRVKALRYQELLFEKGLFCRMLKPEAAVHQIQQ